MLMRKTIIIIIIIIIPAKIKIIIITAIFKRRREKISLDFNYLLLSFNSQVSTKYAGVLLSILPVLLSQ